MGGIKMTDNTNFNLNQTDCIKSQSNFTSTTYYNICTGSTSTVPVGQLDAVVLIIVGAVMISEFLLFAGMAKNIIFDRY